MTAPRNYMQEALNSDAGAWTAGGANVDQVAALETALEATLPASYRNFLASAGSIAIGDSSISGIINGDPLSLDGGSLLGDTIRSRREQMLPGNFVVIQADSDAPYCLDLSAVSDGECAVVCFQASTSTARYIAGSFDQWFTTFFLGRD